MFDTFVPEVAPCEYGIVRQVYSRNPLVLVFHEWSDLLRDVVRLGGLGARLKHLWAPPEWQRAHQDRPAGRKAGPAPMQPYDGTEDWPIHAGW